MMEALFSCINDPKPKKKALTDKRFDPESANAQNAQNYNTANSKTLFAVEPENNQSNFFTPNKKREGGLEHQDSLDDIRVVKTAVNERENNRLRLSKSAARESSMFSWADSNQRVKEESKRQHSYHPADIEWTDKEIKQSRAFAVKHINLYRNSYNANDLGLKGKPEKSAFFHLNVEDDEEVGRLKPIFCGPNCQKDHVHNFEYDFNKNYQDPLSQRPGIDFNIKPKIEQEAAKIVDRSQPCEFGKKQTPINLSTQLPVLDDFKDKAFKFHYEEIDQKQKQLKFNQTGDAFFFDIAKGKSEQQNTNCLCTQTISLFDQHIPQATLHGVQFHFHAPSEHSIDGQLLDLEMHIVHLLDNKREHQNSQFGAGVLGFFFKVMPEPYFTEMDIRYPQADIEWHDRFMLELVKEEKAKTGPREEGMGNLDLAEFVKKLDFNKRWTYQGSLTTAPCDEGILWNVVEGIIPIRQATLDMYTKMRKVEEHQCTNHLADQDPKTIQFLEELKEDIPAAKRSQKEAGNTFMRVAGCNRKVQDQNGRAVFRIDLQD